MIYANSVHAEGAFIGFGTVRLETHDNDGGLRNHNSHVVEAQYDASARNGSGAWHVFYSSPVLNGQVLIDTFWGRTPAVRYEFGLTDHARVFYQSAHVDFVGHWPVQVIRRGRSYGDPNKFISYGNKATSSIIK